MKRRDHMKSGGGGGGGGGPDPTVDGEFSAEEGQVGEHKGSEVGEVVAIMLVALPILLVVQDYRVTWGDLRDAAASDQLWSMIGALGIVLAIGAVWTLVLMASVSDNRFLTADPTRSMADVKSFAMLVVATPIALLVQDYRRTWGDLRGESDTAILLESAGVFGLTFVGVLVWKVARPILSSVAVLPRPVLRRISSWSTLQDLRR